MRRSTAVRSGIGEPSRRSSVNTADCRHRRPDLEHLRWVVVASCLASRRAALSAKNWRDDARILAYATGHEDGDRP